MVIFVCLGEMKKIKKINKVMTMK